MLSFGYTMLTHEAVAALGTAGLDPAVGFLHQSRWGRPNLALDLMEEFRPVIVDAVVFRYLITYDIADDPAPRGHRHAALRIRAQGAAQRLRMRLAIQARGR